MDSEQNVSLTDQLQYNFSELGKYFYLLAIFGLINLIPYIGSYTGIVSFIFIIVMLGVVKSILTQLSNKNLYNFRTKYIRSIIIVFVGIILVTIIVIVVVFYLLLNGYPPANLLSIMYTIIFPLIFLVVIISAIYEFKAWSNLALFFKKNQNSFPEPITRNVIKGTENLKKIVVLTIIDLIILMFSITIAALFFSLYISTSISNIFLLSTSIPFSIFLIGIQIFSYVLSILRSICYFKIGSLRKIKPKPQLSGEHVSSQIMNGVIQPQTNIPTGGAELLHFCPYCGSKIERKGRFCITCGAKLIDNDSK